MKLSASALLEELWNPAPVEKKQESICLSSTDTDATELAFAAMHSFMLVQHEIEIIIVHAIAVFDVMFFWK